MGSTILVLGISAVAFTASFLVHEIAHKIVAQRHGLWAEFRLASFGAIITALSIILPLKFISPGAVMVAGATDKKTMGKTAIAGPVINILLATILFSVSTVWQNGFVLITVAWFNAWIATFNLIPFGIFDGLKVYNWDKKVWSLSFIASVVLTLGLGILFFGGLA
jgi:Zn-dependent protease